MVYLKVIQKITPMDVSVSVAIDQKMYLKKFRGGFSPLSPPGSAYAKLSIFLSVADFVNHAKFVFSWST